MKTRLAASEKNGRKRMAMLGAVYDAERAMRCAADVIAPPGEASRQRDPGPKAAGK